MAQTKVKTKGIADTNVTNAKLGTDISAAKLTAGTVADARFPATLPTASGVNLTALNATNLGSGTVPTARLGTGTASSSVFLAGDNTWAAAGGGKIGQVLQATFTGTQDISAATTWTDITSLSQAITPVATSSKILIIYTINLGGQENAQSRILRDSTAIGIGDAAGNRALSSVSGSIRSDYEQTNHSFTWLDSPSTTSATTYKVQAVGGTTRVNRQHTDTDLFSYARAASTLTLMEVLA